MNGGESLIRALAAHGVDTCFANPGTSEMHMVQAIDAVDDMRAVLCLFEGICSGAADGYGRMRGVPATTLLHLGAGFGNGIANFHNARRAGTPIVNLVGEHARHHVPFDAPLTSDIEGVARPVSSWLRTARNSEGLASDGLDALCAALTPTPEPTGSIATLSIPADCSWGPGHSPDQREIKIVLNTIEESVIATCAGKLNDRSVLLVDGAGLSRAGAMAAGRIATKTGCRVLTITFPAKAEAGTGIFPIERLPYFPYQVLETLAGVEHIVLAGAQPPVSFFAYEASPSSLVPEGCGLTRLANRHDDVIGALQGLADYLDAPMTPTGIAASPRPELPTGDLHAESIARSLAAKIPEGSIVTNDSGGGGVAYPALQYSVEHTFLFLTGGSIGQGGPVAVGAAVAAPGTRVFALIGDGGAMYTNQFLWTAARENLPITVVIYSNRTYNILDFEYHRLGMTEPGESGSKMFDLSTPPIDWVALAKGQGVPGLAATTAEEFNHALDQALETDGPFLIEAVTPAAAAPALPR
ncbi:MAG: acetolactate synthase large subunit [Pseudomonadota bacterium]